MPRRPITNAEAILRLASRHPLLGAKRVAAAGLQSVELSRLVEAGALVRISRGIYRLPGRQRGPHRTLAEAAVRIPRGVICLRSALHFHGMGPKPAEVWMAIPRDTGSPRIGHPALRLFRISGAGMRAGVTEYDLDGVPVAVYSPAKTVADCFKFRSVVGEETARRALRVALRRGLATAEQIRECAKATRTLRTLQPLLDGAAGAVRT